MKINKSFGFAKIERLISPSDMRRTPPCPHFSRCGGCSIMHLDYPSQLALKTEIVRNNLRKNGGFADGEYVFEKIIPSDDVFHYRNKAQFPASLVHGEFACGFFKERSHDIVPIENCLIQSEKNQQSYEYLR
ncbi:MAG: hypothetical protein L6V93_20405 [Clostridiales bacterium]|nr:MAG: hypothetical protein L6V93_20405 [Clostridiales bacterium]